MREHKETGSHLLLIWRSATCLYREAMRSEHRELRLKHVTSLSRLCVKFPTSKNHRQETSISTDLKRRILENYNISATVRN
jgi:hypothetical protein